MNDKARVPNPFADILEWVMIILTLIPGAIARLFGWRLVLFLDDM